MQTGTNLEPIIPTRNSYGPILAFVAIIVLSAFYISRAYLVSLSASFAKGPAASTRSLEKPTYWDLVAQGKITPAEPVLEAMFLYKPKSGTPLSLSRIVKKRGYPVVAGATTDAYKIELLDADRHVVQTTPLAMPNLGSLKQIFFSVLIPKHERSVFFRIRDPKGSIVIERNLARVATDDHPPDVESRL